MARIRNANPSPFSTLFLLTLSCFWLLPLALLSAQENPGRLPPPAMFDESGDKANPLELSSVKIEAQIQGYAARSRVTMVFYNPTSRPVAGNLYFPLPAQATISGYALDIQGSMVDGVAVERDTARQTYNTIMARGIDPGLVEWSKGNVFKTRVFPVPARGSRSVRVEFTSPIDASPSGALYLIPLNYRSKLKNFSIDIEVLDTKAKPLIRETSLAGMDFLSWKSGFRARSELANASVAQDLIIALPPVASDPVTVERGRDGKLYAAWYGLRSELLAKAGPPPAKDAAPKRLSLYWDASLSRNASDHKRIRDTLVAYFARFPKAAIQVSLIVFRDLPEAPRNFNISGGRADELLQYLAAIPYDGATRFLELPKAAAGSDLAILVSDGLSSLGAAAFDPGVPLFALSVEQSFDAARLEAMAQASGGALIRVDKAQDAALRIGSATFRFQGIEILEGKTASVIPMASTALSGAVSGDLVGVIGIVEGKSAKLNLRFGYGAATSLKVPVSWADPGVEGESIPAESFQGRAIHEGLWGSSELARLMVLPDADSPQIQGQIEALGRDYNLVTPRTSLLVLESLEQYLEFRIRPPQSLAAMRADYDRSLTALEKDQKKERESAIEKLVTLWNERRAWWEKKFDYPPNFRYAEKSDKKSAEGFGGEAASEESVMRDVERPSVARAQSGAGASDSEADFAADSDALTPKAESAGESSAPSISIQAWKPDTPYLKRLDGASGGKSGQISDALMREAYDIYLAERPAYLNSPGFYLDVGDWFERAGRPALAARIWSNLAELELESPNLLRVLAKRLSQDGMYARARDIFREVALMRPEEPHSFRDLALVLDRLGEHAEAVDLLYKVALGSYPQWPEIELIALNELNAALARAAAAGQKHGAIDPRLVKLLDADLRIVMGWDTDLSDMDLWVIEPSDEKAYYGHRQTTIGGLVSRDITAGYGPEEYSLRKAMKGVYTVKVHYYGNRNPEVSGTVTVNVEVITDWGRKNEKRKPLTLRLTGQSDTYLVGEISF